MKPKVALFLYHPRCSIDSCNGIIKSLSPHFDFKIFTQHELEDTFLDDIDMVIFPGGIGDSDSYDFLMKRNSKAIKAFLARGGKYLGICMGAYWADKTYLDILDGIRVVQYIKRPTADIRRSYGKAAPIAWDGAPYHMYFYDGCTYIGAGKMKIVATYANGDPMAVMQDNIGLIGCHPESELHWYNKPYLLRHWHEGKHYKLLADFAKRLMEN